MAEDVLLEANITSTSRVKADIITFNTKFYTKYNWWLIILIIAISTGLSFVSFLSLNIIGVLLAILINSILFFIGNIAITKRTIIKLNGEIVRDCKI